MVSKLKGPYVMGDRRLIVAGVILNLLFFWAGASTSAQAKPPREDSDSGAHLYREFCSSCHGDSGKGDGPGAETLPRRPTDLTRLARRNGGVFPRKDVLAVVEAVKQVPDHPRPPMPNWWDMFYRLERGNERALRQRIDALVSHIESLQLKD